MQDNFHSHALAVNNDNLFVNFEIFVSGAIVKLNKLNNSTYIM